MSKRKFPLFIIDVSHAHGRAWETDYISCTSAELPFIAEVTYISEEQYLKEYDKTNDKIIYSNSSGVSRIRIEVVNIREDYDQTQLRGLLTRALKEFITRRSIVAYKGEPTDEAVVAFTEELIKQGNFRLRTEPGNTIVRNSVNILEKIKRDYERKSAN